LPVSRSTVPPCLRRPGTGAPVGGGAVRGHFLALQHRGWLPQPDPGVRKEFDLFANLRPVFSLPGDYSRAGIDMLIVRENSEGLYSGREHREGDTAIAERVITRLGSERIVRVACEEAMQRATLHGKPPVLTIVHKANVLKLTDGLFRECA